MNSLPGVIFGLNMHRAKSCVSARRKRIRDLEQEEVQDVMKQLQNSSYNKSIVRQVHIAALHKEQQQIAEAVERAERGDDS